MAPYQPIDILLNKKKDAEPNRHPIYHLAFTILVRKLISKPPIHPSAGN